MLTPLGLQARIDAAVLAQLTDPEGVTPDQAKLAQAIADSAAVVEGYLLTVPAEDRPADATLEAHQVSIALYLLASNRPGVEIDAFKARHDAAVKFLESVRSRRPVGATLVTEGPDPIFDDESLDHFGGERIAG